MAEFFAIFGFTFSLPFIPQFLNQDLGISDQRQLAVIAGYAGSASGLALVIFSPIWGFLADRFGKKAMLVRALIGGGIFVALIGVAQNPGQLIALRFLQGMGAGTVAAATALIAADVPRERVGWALGLMTSAISAGNAIGPFVGGLLAPVIGLRASFFAGGGLLLISVLPVAVLVKEVKGRAGRRRSPPLLATLRQAPAGTTRALTAVVVCQALLQTGMSMAIQLLVLRLLVILPGHSTLGTGLSFGLVGVTGVVAAMLYTPLARIAGWVRLEAVLCLLAALCFFGTGVLPSPAAVILVFGASGFLTGMAAPMLNALLGLEAPRSIQGTIYGVSASAVALGYALGPALAGNLAGAGSLLAGFVAAAIATALVSVLITVFGREPARA